MDETGAVDAEQEAIAEIGFPLPPKSAALSMAVFVAIGGVLTYEACAGRGPYRVEAAVGALGFAYGIVRQALRLFTGKPWAVLMSDGMTFGYSRTVTWDEVKSVAIVPGMSRAAWKGSISVELHDPDAYLDRITWAQRRNARIGMRKGYGPIQLPGEAFSVPLEDVVATMRQFNPDLTVLE